MNMSIGSSRNLTAQFVKLRSQARQAQGLTGGSGLGDDRGGRLLPGGATSSSDVELGTLTGRLSSMAPSWVAKADRLKQEMAVLKQRLDKLKEVHGKALLVTFGSNNDAQQAAVESLTREIQASFKKLDGDIRSLGAGAGSAEDAAVQTQLQRQAAQALFKLSVEFRKEETRFLNKVEAQKGLAKGSSIGLIEDDAKPGLAAASDALSTQAQVAMVDMSVHLIEQRDQEIRKIVETIMELGQIMKDLSTLVVEQGTMLDRIDANLQDVSAKVEAGVEQIQAANKTQKESGALTCILGLVVAIIIMLIVVIIRRT